MRPHIGYKTHDGKRVRGVTTITGRFKDSAGLIHWAWKEGHEGRDYRESRDKAADGGTVGHELVYHRVNRLGEPKFPTASEDAVKRGWAAFRSYLRWEEQTKLDIVHPETALVFEGCRCGHLLGEHDPIKAEPDGGRCAICDCQLFRELNYGGTLDAVGLLNDETCLLDWKTGAGVYGNMLLQLAGYDIALARGSLVDAETGKATGKRLNLTMTGGWHLLRFGQHGDFHHHHWPADAPAIELAREAFLLQARGYEIDLVLKKAV